MVCYRFRSIAFAGVLVAIAGAGVRAQIPLPLSDKVIALAGEWKREPGRGAGGICGVSDDDVMAFDVTADPASVVIRAGRVNGRVPLDGSSAGLGVGVWRDVVATTDAGWMKLTMTQPRNGGYANVMQEVYILNRNRSELTVWRTLNTVLPDGSSGKIDCGNRAAIVYLRRSNAK